MATNHFNHLLNALLSSDNEVRHQAEDSYNNLTPAFKVTHLLAAIQNGQQPEENRLMAAVLLRRLFALKFLKSQQLSQQEQGQLLQEILLAVQQQVSPNLSQKICEVAAEAARSLVDDDGTNHWPDFMQFIFQCANSPSAHLQESALRMFANVPLIFGNHEAEYLALIMQMLAKSMESTAEIQVRSQAVHALCAFVLSHDREKEAVIFKQFGDLLPRMILIIAQSIDAEEDQSLLKVLIDMTESRPKYLRSQLEAIFEICMKAFSTQGVQDSWRYLVLEVMVSFCENDPAMVRKRGEKYVITLIPLLLQMMTDIDDDEDWATSDTVEGDDNSENSAIAETSLDRLTCALGGKAVLPHVMNILPVMLSHADWTQRYAALMAISAIREGCHKQMEGMLDQIMARLLIFLQDPHPRVRYAVCNAIGLMAIDFTPLFEKKFHGQIIPGLLALFDDEANPRVQAHASAALAKFSEDCPKNILIQYLDGIMGKVESVLNFKLANKLVLEQIVTLIAYVAETCEKEFVPYYDRIMPYLKYIMQNTNSEDFRILRGKTIKCVSIVVLAVGREKFITDSGEVMDMMFKTHSECDYPDDDLQTSYLLTAWARMCTLLGKQFEQYLPQVIGPVMHTAAMKPEAALLENDEIGDFACDVDWSVINLSEHLNFAIRTAGMEDKVCACQMLGFYARELKEGFADYIEEVVRLLVPMLAYYFHDGVRTAAAESLPSLLDCAKVKGSQYLEGMWLYICPELLKAIGVEPKDHVQAELLSSLAQSIKTLGPNYLNDVAMKLISEMIDKYMDTHFERTDKHMTASNEDDYDDGVEDELAVQEDANSYILSKVVDVLHALFLTQKELFLPYFDKVALKFIKLLDPARSWTDRQWGLCVFYDLIEFCGPASDHYQELFTPVFLQYVSDKSPKVRHAAIYGCGILGQFGGERFAVTYAQIIPHLIQIVSDPSSREPENVNPTECAISAVAKILKYNKSVLQNIDEIINVWFAWLPVTENEYKALHTYDYLCDLIEENNPIILGTSNSNLPRIVSIIAQAFVNKVVAANSEVGSRMLGIVKRVESDPEIFQACANQLTPEMQLSLQEAYQELALSSSARH